MVSHVTTAAMRVLIGGSALSALRCTQAEMDQASARREEAIIRAIRAGCSLRSVAALACCSHEAVRRITELRAPVVVDLWGYAYPLTFHQGAALAERLEGSAPPVAVAIRQALDGSTSESVHLDSDAARAVYQVLRLGFTERPGRLAALFAALRETFER
jgi:hypothetical protein